MRIAKYSFTAPISEHTVLALAADIHNKKCESILAVLRNTIPDYILVCGDLLHAASNSKTIYDYIPQGGKHIRSSKNALMFLRETVKIAPVLFSSGNHELYLDDDDKSLLHSLGVIYLDNCYEVRDKLVFGGLSSPYSILAGTGTAKTKEEHKRRWELIFEGVNTSWIDDFERQNGYKILLCHHPEFYEPFLKDRKGIQLILSGHAHGGQIRLFGKGLFAYGQGFFPKYTKGLYDEKIIISAGLSNTSKIPRLGNPTELVYIDLIPDKIQNK